MNPVRCPTAGSPRGARPPAWRSRSSAATRWASSSSGCASRSTRAGLPAPHLSNPCLPASPQQRQQRAAGAHASAAAATEG
eukprot:scaffold58202_cov69-Phaeocystis_antarctica.AAC.2